MRFDLRSDLTAMKDAAKLAIDDAAEQARLKYITPGAGQAMVYQAKQEEAQRYLATSPANNVATDWPLLSAEIGITGADLAAVANTIVTMANQWTSIAATIEAKRLAAKKAIDAAGNGSAIATAQNITWP
jgi:hypothetical protein